MVLQFILRAPGSIWRAGVGIWRVGGGIWRKMQISDNLDFKPENYLLGFDAGRSITHRNTRIHNDLASVLKITSLFTQIYHSKGVPICKRTLAQIILIFYAKTAIDFLFNWNLEYSCFVCKHWKSFNNPIWVLVNPLGPKSTFYCTFN